VGHVNFMVRCKHVGSEDAIWRRLDQGYGYNSITPSLRKHGMPETVFIGGLCGVSGVVQTRGYVGSDA
jgi:hypothetical protein